jgi:tetratricopeptide (TPR) repeat protein
MTAPQAPAALASALRLGRWREVIAACEPVVAQGLDADGSYAALLARAYFRLGQPERCAEAAGVAERTGAGPSVALAVAEAHLATGDPSRALRKIEALLETLDPAVDAEARAAWRDAAVTASAILRAAGEAERAYGLALRAVAEADPASDDPVALDEALVALGTAAWACGRGTEALRALERARDLRERRDADPVHRAEVLDALGDCVRAMGDAPAAVALHRAALALWSAAIGPTSANAAACLHRLAHALHRSGDFEAARDAMRESVLHTAEHLGRDHVDTWISRFELARYDIDCGDFTDGFARMARARAQVARRIGSGHPVVRAMDRYL